MDASAILANSTLIINAKTIRRGPIRKIFPKKAPREKLNEQIRAAEIRVIDDAGNQLGVMSVPAALQIAQDQGVDLVEIAPMAKPPVCKIMNYGKFQYQQSKQDRVNKSKQKKVDIKKIRLGVRTDDHDMEFKKNQIEKFLSKGHKVKIEIVLRGREKAHADLARNNLLNFIKSISIPHATEQEVKRFPGGFNTIIAPQ